MTDTPTLHEGTARCMCGGVQLAVLFPSRWCVEEHAEWIVPPALGDG